MAAQNIYQMILETGFPVFVQRNSWRTGVAEVVAVEPPVEEWPRDAAPYFGNPTVFALVKYGSGTPYELQELSSPGTFAYERLAAAPAWWRGGLNYPVKGGVWKGKRLELSAEGFAAIPRAAPAVKAKG